MRLMSMCSTFWIFFSVSDCVTVDLLFFFLFLPMIAAYVFPEEYEHSDVRKVELTAYESAFGHISGITISQR